MNLFTPAEVAKNYVAIGKGKVNIPIVKLIVLGLMAGAFVALGGVSSTAVAVSLSEASFGKFLGACIFPGGLTMVLLAGSELFTGNALLVIPLLEKEIKLSGVFKNWVFVYIGNFIGSLLVASAIVFSHQVGMFDNGLAVSIISTAATKCSLSFSDAFIRGIMCNFLVCIAVWISFAAKDVANKIIGLFFPILIFVICGFEHCVANMYYISAGLLAKTNPVYMEAAKAAGVNLNSLSLKGFLVDNMIPVTLGNIVGGLFVGCIYWYLYLKKASENK